jgi:alcohol dehydrogenase
MKAFVYLGPGAKALADRPIPELQNPGDALVRVVKTTI